MEVVEPEYEIRHVPKAARLPFECLDSHNRTKAKGCSRS